MPTTHHSVSRTLQCGQPPLSPAPSPSPSPPAPPTTVSVVDSVWWDVVEGRWMDGGMWWKVGCGWMVGCGGR